jgi:hypothetical protein
MATRLVQRTRIFRHSAQRMNSQTNKHTDFPPHVYETYKLTNTQICRYLCTRLPAPLRRAQYHRTWCVCVCVVCVLCVCECACVCVCPLCCVSHFSPTHTYLRTHTFTHTHTHAHTYTHTHTHTHTHTDTHTHTHTHIHTHTRAYAVTQGKIGDTQIWVYCYVTWRAQA